VITLAVAQVNSTVQVVIDQASQLPLATPVFGVIGNRNSGFAFVTDIEAHMALGLNGYATKMRISNFLTISGSDGRPRIAFVPQ
jgi:hypothetical protein